MKLLMNNILQHVRSQGAIDDLVIERAVRARNQGIVDDAAHFSKKKLVMFYLRQRAEQTALWQEWGLTPEEEQLLAPVLRMKPRRTASGVATITVITKPFACGSNCLYCPNDIRMPKSYLTNEPACQRAERNYFDPYLQVTSRLRALRQMGHTTDKVELIVLGGTWSDYPEPYQRWFVQQLFQALNEGGSEQADKRCEDRRRAYMAAGVEQADEALREQSTPLQARVNAGKLTYNQAVAQLYGCSSAWRQVSSWQQASWGLLEAEHAANVNAAHRVVGLVMETRPDVISVESLRSLRHLGATKVQMGIQSLDQRIVDANNRGASVDNVVQAFELLRLFGFKSHVHMMANLLGSTPESDKADYALLLNDPRFRPDEVKLYPCALVEGTGLVAHYKDGSWQPYSEEQLMDVLVEDTLATPAFMRISRMIRDISACDIMVGNKKTNLRQMVEQAVHADGRPYEEIRLREVSTGEVSLEDLSLQVVSYDTTVTQEHFLQWVTPAGALAGFCRLSLPLPGVMSSFDGLPVSEGQAMIREVHVYGKVAGLHKADGSAQHAGLGRQLVERACQMAWEAGYSHINVISSIGTRAYYQRLGFDLQGLYQVRDLGAVPPIVAGAQREPGAAVASGCAAGNSLAAAED